MNLFTGLVRGVKIPQSVQTEDKKATRIKTKNGKKLFFNYEVPLLSDQNGLN